MPENDNEAQAREARWKNIVDATCTVITTGCTVLTTAANPNVQTVLHHIGKILGLGFVDAAAALHHNALAAVPPMNELDEFAELHRLSGEYVSALVAINSRPGNMLAVAELNEQQRELFFQDLTGIVVDRARAYASLDFGDLLGAVLERAQLNAVIRGG